MKNKLIVFLLVVFTLVPRISLGISTFFSTSDQAILNYQKNCKETTDQREKFFCIIEDLKKTGNFKGCDELNGEYKDECYYSMSVDNKNIKLCEFVIGQKTKDMCYSANAKDEKTCNIIKTPSSKARCLEKINPKKLTSKLCSSIDKKENGGSEYDTCYYKVATINNDISLCKKMTSNSGINNCFFDFATKKINMKYCNLINIDTGSNGKNWCITVIGRLTKNKKVCELIKDKQEKESCYANI